MISSNAFYKTQERIDPFVNRTPLRRSQWLSRELNAEIYLKLECLNPGRSFKIRGATNALLSQEKLPKRVITASGGNHGLGVAIAAKRLDLPCSVILPKSTSNYRIQLLEELGAEVKLHGEAWDEANVHALELAQADDILYIHPFADEPVMLGQGTIALELEEQLDEYDVIMASIGGGGLLGGIALAIESLNKPVSIYGVETLGADSLAQSLKNDKLVELEEITSIAKTLGAKKTTPFIFKTMKRLIDEMFVINDKDAVYSIFEFLNQEKILIEPATSCIISAALQNPEKFKDKTCVFIICGSNVTYKEAVSWQKQFDIKLSKL